MNPTALRNLLANPRILHDGDPMLRLRAKPVSSTLRKSPEFAHLVEVMVAQMRGAPGVGLATLTSSKCSHTDLLSALAPYYHRITQASAPRAIAAEAREVCV